MTTSSNEPKMGKFKKSWLLFKASLKTLRLDKELMSLPIINVIATFVAMAPFAVIVALNQKTFFTVVNYADGGVNAQPTNAGIVMMVTAGIIVTALGAIFSGALISGALARFKGEDPTIKSSIKGALRRGGSLIGFGLFSALIGYILSSIAERIPFIGGKIVLWLASSAWNVASFFAVPVIVSSDTPINPVAATKESIGVIKKVWGESLILSVSIGIIGVLSTIVYFMLLGGLFALGVSQSFGGIYFGVTAGLWLAGLILFALAWTALEAIVKAAIYHYAVTGEAPAAFEERMLRSAFTPKKAKKVFAS